MTTQLQLIIIIIIIIIIKWIHYLRYTKAVSMWGNEDPVQCTESSDIGLSKQDLRVWTGIQLEPVAYQCTGTYSIAEHFWAGRTSAGFSTKRWLCVITSRMKY